jgi:hypothetical protein
MAFNGTGTFSRLYNWLTDKTNSIPITASRMDDEFNGIATGLSSCITKDGQTTITANIPFNSRKITGLGVGNARTDSINIGQVQDGQFTYLGTTGGAADAYTLLSPSPAITAYTTTMRYCVKIHATNATITPYLQISSIGTPASDAVIKKINASGSEVAVDIGEIIAGKIYQFQRNSSNDAWILLRENEALVTSRGISYLPNQIILSNNVSNPNTHIDASAGNFQFSDGSGQAVSSAITKRLDASWTPGTNQGGLFSGTKAINSTYHYFAIHNPTTLAKDGGFLLGVAGTVPNPTSVLPSGYTKFERRGSILTDASGNIRGFTQIKNYFILSNRVSDFSGTATTTATLHSLTVPLGLSLIANIDFWADPNAGYLQYGLISSPLTNSEVPSSSNFNAEVEQTYENRTKRGFDLFTNRSGQIRTRWTGTAEISQRIFTKGWLDTEI